MKKNILFSFILFSSSLSHAMFTRQILKPQLSLVKTREITSQHPYLKDVYECLANKNISHENKKRRISFQLHSDPDLTPHEKKILRILEDIATLNIKPDTTEEQSLLFRIIKENDTELLNLALDNRFKLHIESKNIHNNTPLYLAAQWGYPAIVETLIEHEANVNSKNENGKTPVIGTVLALQKSHNPQRNSLFLAILKLLQESKADIFMPDDNNKRAEDYILKALDELHNHRRRTQYNENGDLINFYEQVQTMLEEWY